MAHVISDECVSCGSCEGECPVVIENRRVITRRRDTVCGKLPAAVSLCLLKG